MNLIPFTYERDNSTAHTMATHSRCVVLYLRPESVTDLDHFHIRLVVPFSVCCNGTHVTWMVQTSTSKVVEPTEFGTASIVCDISACFSVFID